MVYLNQFQPPKNGTTAEIMYVKDRISNKAILKGKNYYTEPMPWKVYNKRVFK